MKDFTQHELEQGVTGKEAMEWLEMSLKAIFDDTERRVGDSVVNGLTFEWLSGALIAAKKRIRALELEEQRQDEIFALLTSQFTIEDWQKIDKQLNEINDKYHE